LRRPVLFPYLFTPPMGLRRPVLFPYFFTPLLP
jgi:hypothetical protein